MTMKLLLTRLLILCSSFLFFQSSIRAQQVDPKLAEALQHALDSMHQQLGINGLSAALQLPNDAVWAGGSGVSTFQPMDTIRPEHVFATGSSTKTVTAAAILQLVDEGVLTLSDSLHHWLPDFPHINPNITIRQLLRHQSGLYDLLQNPSFQPTLLQNVNQIWELEEVITTFIQPPYSAPGTNWRYSNTNYLLLAMIIETATGNTFHEEINQRFFDPLGLESFVNLAYDPLPEDVAHLWLDLNGDGQLDDAHNFFTGWRSMFSATGPAGGYFAQPQDLARWMRLAMSGSLFSEATWAAATTTVNTPLPGNSRYGLGLTQRDYLGLTSFGHGGDISYSTTGVYFPEKDISIAVQANDASINSWNLAAVVRALLGVYIECEAVLNTTHNEFTPLEATIYPNPFRTRATLEINLPTTVDQMELRLLNTNGQLSWSADYGQLPAGTHQLEVVPARNLPSGVYLIQLLTGEAVRGHQKVLIK